MVRKYNIEIEACFNLVTERKSTKQYDFGRTIKIGTLPAKNGLVCDGLEENDGMWPGKWMEG